MTKTRYIALTVLALACCLCASAQESKYKFDLGGSLGVSGYIGDANRSPLLRHPGFTIDASGRYLHNSRLAVRGVLGLTTLSGNTADMGNVLPGGANYKFTSAVIDLGVRGEFNFLPYGIGETYKRLSRVSPYLTLGVGVATAISGGHVYAAPNIPMGMGVKYKLKERVNLGVEFTMTKMFSDKIDGEPLHDLTGIKTEFYKDTDWVSRLTFSISFEFGERCETCHYVD